MATGQNDSVWVAGVPVVDIDLRGAVERAVDTLRRPDADPTPYRFVNAYSIALARSNADYRRLLADSGVNYADGMPLARVVRHLARRPKGRLPHVRGPSFFEQVIDLGRGSGIRHYFFGGTHDTVTALLLSLERRYPGLVIAGASSPPFRMMTDAEWTTECEMIVKSRPDIVWVALGTPKQDYETERLVERTRISAAAVGAAFDFLAGTKPMAPRWIRFLDIEWLFRLATEPHRLWRRYLIGNVQFLAAVFPDLLGRRQQ